MLFIVFYSNINIVIIFKKYYLPSDIVRYLTKNVIRLVFTQLSQTEV